MKRTKLIISALLLSTAGAFAQQAEPTANQQNATTEKPANDVTEQIKKLVIPSGFLQTGYTYTDEPKKSTFLLRRARLVLQGDLYKGDAGKVDYKLQLELTGTPKILDLFVRYRPINEFGLRLGQYKSPLSIENSEYNPAKLEFVEYSLVVKRLARMSGSDLSGYNQNGRDLGLEFLGSAFKKDGYSLLNYELAIFNGHTLNANDNNESKDIVGRLIVNPIKELSVAGYFQWGEGALSGYNEATRKFAAQDTNLYVSMNRFGGGVAYKSAKAFARAEYIAGKTGDLNSQGFYVAGGYQFVKGLSLVARYDFFDDDTDNSDYSEQDYTVGLDYNPVKPIDLKLNYTLENNKGRDNRNGIYFMVTVKY